MKRTFLTIVAAVACLSHPLGYTPIGYKWASSTVPYYVNAQNAYVPLDHALAAIQYGASAWRNQSNAGIELVYSGVTDTSAFTFNGRNEVFFRNDPSGSTLAQTTWWAYATGEMVEADIVFYESHNWNTVNQVCTSGYYIENTATHEFGHALGLEHSSVPEATMWPSSGSCETIRTTLDPDDIAGIEFLYPSSGTPPPPPPPPAVPTLSATVKGGMRVDLRWSGLVGPSASITRNQVQWTTANDGNEVDRVKQRGTFSYTVCADVCTPSVVVTIR